MISDFLTWNFSAKIRVSQNINFPHTFSLNRFFMRPQKILCNLKYMGRWFLTYDFETSDVWLEDIFDDFQTLCMRWSWWWSSSKGPRDFVKRKRDGSPVTNSMQRTEVCCSVNLHHHWKAVLISIHFCESVNSRFDMEMQLATQCLEITQNVALDFSNFGIFN